MGSYGDALQKLFHNLPGKIKHPHEICKKLFSKNILDAKEYFDLRRKEETTSKLNYREELLLLMRGKSEQHIETFIDILSEDGQTEVVELIRQTAGVEDIISTLGNVSIADAVKATHKSILVLGKTGSGKSLLCTNLCEGKMDFPSAGSPGGITRELKIYPGIEPVRGRYLKIVDTPGTMDQDHLKETEDEIVKAITVTEDGYDVFLIVCRKSKIGQYRAENRKLQWEQQYNTKDFESYQKSCFEFPPKGNKLGQHYPGFSQDKALCTAHMKRHSHRLYVRISEKYTNMV